MLIIIPNKIPAMEDAHIHLLSLPNDKDTCFFGVFDGHGGLYACCLLYSLHHNM